MAQRGKCGSTRKSPDWGLNPGPPGYILGALTTELYGPEYRVLVSDSYQLCDRLLIQHLLPCLLTHHCCRHCLSSPLPRMHHVGPQTHPLPLPHHLTTLDPLLPPLLLLPCMCRVGHSDLPQTPPHPLLCCLAAPDLPPRRLLPRVHHVGPSYLSLAVLLPRTSLLAPLPVCALGPPSWPAHHPAAVCWCLSYPTPPHHLLHHLGPLDAAQTPPLPFLHCLGPWDPLSSHSLTVSTLDPLFCLLSLTSLLCTSWTLLGPPPFLAPVLWTPRMLPRHLPSLATPSLQTPL